jgi:imidazolonepropionase-like amidohydrolase
VDLCHRPVDAPGAPERPPLGDEFVFHLREPDGIVRLPRPGRGGQKGTDAGGFPWDEINQAEELRRYVALGMTPWQALKSATVTAAS